MTLTAGNTSSTLDQILKEVYGDIEDAIFETRVLTGLLPKKTDAVGRELVNDVIFNAGQSHNFSFTNAQNAASLTSDGVATFKVPMVEDTASVTFSTKIEYQSENNKGAFVDAVSMIMDNAIRNFANDVEVTLFRSQTGVMGQISSDTTIASNVLKLKNSADVWNFNVGSQLDLSNTSTGTTVKAQGSGNHPLYVKALDRIQGILYIGVLPSAGSTSCNISDGTDGVPTAAQGDYIFITGSKGIGRYGLEDWVPYGGVSTTDSFSAASFNRSVDAQRLAGNWMDGTVSGSISSVLEDAAALTHMGDGEFDVVIMTPQKFAAFAKELGTKQVVDNLASTGQVGYRALKVVAPWGEVSVVGARACPANRIWCIKKSAWKLCSVKPFVHVFQQDGLSALRLPGAMGAEARLYSFGNLICLSPKDNCVIQVNP
jgi:hypothetical protein